MKTRIIIAFALLSSTVSPLFAQTTEEGKTTTENKTIECSSKTYFTENQCEVCYDGGEINTVSGEVQLKKMTLSWENKLDSINQNFYETSQSIAEIKTNMGTAPNPWDETGLEWASDIVWKDNDDLNIFTLTAGKTVNIKEIAADTKVTLTSPKQPTSPHLVVKIPISYYELKMGTFKESDKKTKNYCVGYTSKKITTTVPATSNPPLEKSTNLESDTETIIPEILVERNPDEITTNNPTEEEIPSYDATVDFNSAGTDPEASEASLVATGPAQNIIIFLAAIFLSLLILPKINTLLTSQQ